MKARRLMVTVLHRVDLDRMVPAYNGNDAFNGCTPLYHDVDMAVFVRNKSETAGTIFIKDSSGNNNNGIPIGGPTFVQGKIGKARDFNGTSDYLTMGTGSSLAFGTGSFSFGGWIKTSDSGNYKTIISKAVSNAGATLRYYNRIEATTGTFHASLGGRYE